MPEKPLVIYRSSAGSGKTYTLTKEYLKLAFKHPDYFKHILAVTFTNKATREMKNRIISVLKNIIQGGHELETELKESTGLNDIQLKVRSKEILVNILHNYSYFSVSTIDSFFQRVIRAFAREMGLQGGFRIELDEEQVMTEVIDKVLLEVGQNENLTKWLIKFAETRVDDGKAWDTRREIGNLAKEIFKEQFKTFESDVLTIAKDEKFIPGFLEELRQVKSRFEDKLRKIGSDAMVIIRKHQLDVTDFAYKEGGPAGYLEKLVGGQFNAPGIRIETSALDLNSWSSKTNPLRARVIAAAQDGLVQLLAEAVLHYKEHQMEYESASEVLRYLYTFGILTDLTAKLQEYRDENEVMLISDAAVFLKQIIADTDAPFIYEKVGSRYHHYLIDEFQDTSGFQWDNFRPLIENSLAENNFNLVVGDVKQSIYRWRGGDLELLLSGIENDIGAERTDHQDLTQNWRSRQNIVDFNNSLFRFARELFTKQANDKIAEVIDEEAREALYKKSQIIEKGYAEVIQECARNYGEDESGLVRFRFFPWSDMNDVDWKDNALLQIPGMVEELQDQRYDLKDIAILVRTRTEGRVVVDHLLNYQSSQTKTNYRYDVISSESLYLENSSVTRFLIATLNYIYKTDDFIQRVHMAYEYHRYIHRQNKTLNALFAISSDKARESEFIELFPYEFFAHIPQLRKLPVYQLMENLIRIFGLDHFEEERAYLQGFLDAVLDFTKTENDDILSFLSWWELLGKERTVMVSEDQDAIRVMTIHMAKGLQFKAVLVPFCDWGMDNLQGWDSVLWSHNHKGKPFESVPYLPLNYTSKLKSTLFFKDYYEELIKSYLDNLNILYVAFTRAEEVIMGCCLQHKSKGEVRGASAVVGEYLRSEYKLEAIEAHIKNDYEEITLGNFPSVGIEELEKDPIEAVTMDHFPSYPWSDRLTIKRELAEISVTKEVNVIEPIVLVEIIKSTESMATLNSTLSDKINRGIAHENERGDLQQALNEILKNEEVAFWFNPKYQVALEALILMPDSNEVLIDRIVYSDKTIKLIQFVTTEPSEDAKRNLKVAQEHFKLSGKSVHSYFFIVGLNKVEEVQIG
ncbi:MAG: UvrD-helicase domain-containing protein [Bacteroidetes bacterium]|nr:UvrD-helicase domain-containing protein [Bacteroidota bacterium]MDA1120479.1 UvrD-helicase domain-containing protein [Bacteroidota bacterium]